MTALASYLNFRDYTRKTPIGVEYLMCIDGDRRQMASKSLTTALLARLLIWYHAMSIQSIHVPKDSTKF